jgi:2-oxoglutarate dehydrogenase E2 component (dihydrolipoamide succinyltransferase)
MATEIRVPTLGESVTEATIGKWFKKTGEAVKADEPLVELETDKVTLEVNAPASGVLAEITVKDGETVGVGALLGQIAEGSAGAVKSAAKSAPAAPAVAAAPASAASVEIRVPTLGESVSEATIGKWFKKAGDAVKADEPLVELETDKVTLEVNAPAAGTLADIGVKDGETVGVGALLGHIAAGAGAAASAPAPTPAAAPASPPSPMPPSPAAAKIAADRGINANAIEGSGKRGQVLKGDVLSYVAPAQAAPAPVQMRAPSAPIDAEREERVRMTKLRQTIARRLKDAQSTAAMLTTFNEVDMTEVMALRARYKDVFEKKHAVKLGFMSFFVKACVAALKEIPAVNAEIDGQDLVYKNYYHLGIAVGTDKGLVVPVVRDADQLGLAGIEKTIAGLGRKARDGQLKIEDMQGGTFTITNGGIYGSLMSTPILNAPQSGILGMHKIQERPMVIGGKIEVRPMMYLALSYDHRIVDGKEAVTFLVRVKEALEDPSRLLLDL